MSPPLVSDVSLIPAAPSVSSGGLIGFVAATIDGVLRVDGLALRRTRSGRLVLTFPTRRDRRGREHPYLRPTCARVRLAIEAAILGELGLAEAASTPLHGVEEISPTERRSNRHKRQGAEHGRLR